MLEVKNLCKSYGNRQVLRNINLYLQRNEIVGLLGPNGSGKTTLFKCILGLEKIDKGEIKLENYTLNFLPIYKRAKLGLSYLPQEISVFPDLTAYENIFSILEYYHPSPEEETEKLLQEFHLEKVKNIKAKYLSGGQKRRLEIARALSISPKYILLDEPFAGVDPIAISDIKKIVVKLKKRGLGVLITDHNVLEMLNFTDRNYILFEGEILASGNKKEILNNSKVKEIYLGHLAEIAKKI